MVTKKKSTGKKQDKGRVKVAKLTLNKESVKDLTANQQKQIGGGKGKQIISAPMSCGCE